MKRLFKEGVVTTVLGVLIVAGSVYMFISKDHTNVEAGELAAIGLIFLRSKDSLIGLGGKDEQPGEPS